MKKGFGYILTACILISGGFTVGYILPHDDTSSKDIVSFESLPYEIKKNYVHRKNIDQVVKYLRLDKSKLIAVSSEPINGSDDELKAQIQTLREKNQALLQDNINLSDKSWELSKRLQNQQQQIDEEKRKLRSKNLQTINEAEKQHYKNVNDLTRRINDLQQEAIDTTKNYENQIIKLEDENDKLKQQLQKKDFEIDEEISAATKQERISNSTLAEKNRYLLDQIAIMKNRLQKQTDEHMAELQVKKTTIQSLKESINQKDIKANTLLANHTKEILQMEQKNASILRELRQKLTDMQSEYKKELFAKNQEISKLLETKKKEISALKQELDKKDTEIKKVGFGSKEQTKLDKDKIASLQKNIENLQKDKIKLNEQVKNLEQNLSSFKQTKAKEYEKMLADVKNGLQKEKQSEQENIKNLEYRILQAADIIEGLRVKNKELKTQLKVNETLKINIDPSFKENEKKHAKNYEILNKKIAFLKEDRDKIFAETKKQIEKMKKDIEIKARKLKGKDKNASSKGDLLKIASLKKELDEGKLRIKELEKKAGKLQELNAELTKQNNSYKMKENEKTVGYEKKYNEISKKMIASSDKIKELNDKIKDLEGKNNLLSSSNNDIKTVQSRYEKANDSLKDSQKKIMELKDQLIFLQKENTSLSKENSSLRSTQEHSKKSYEDRIKINKQTLDVATSKIEELNKDIMSLKGDIVVLEKKNKELVAKNTKNTKNTKSNKVSQDTLNDLRNRKAEIMALKNEVNELKSKNELLKNQANTLNVMNKEGGENNNSEFKKLKEENLLLKDKLALLKLKKNTKTPAPLKLLQSIKCDDMPSGSNDATSKCKSKVKDALAKYSANNFFEIVPIVDNGGFSSLKKVQRSKIGIPLSEIKRLTRLSNIGLGKDRAKSGGKLIVDIIGKSAKISYPNENLSISKKRGFVIKIYE